MHAPSLFKSFFMAGFECSSQRRRDGKRLDLLATTGHDRLALRDYRQVRGMGLRAARDGLRWHLIEREPGRYDWSSFLPMLRASREAGTQVIWDLAHYGYPDDLDFWGDEFVGRFAAFAGAAARVVRDETDEVPFYSVINEISFWAWAGDATKFHPVRPGGGDHIKRRLVRAAIAGIDAVRAVDPRARFVQADPIINVLGGHLSEIQYAGWDMLCGLLEPELGGKPEYLDIVGVNYYSDNQWRQGDHPSTIPMGHHDYKPFSELLADAHARYGRPILVAETGAEGGGRAAWFFYVCQEIRTAMSQGLPIEGACIYPVTEYISWDEDRVAPTGLMGLPGEDGSRKIHTPLAEELARQQAIMASLRAGGGHPAAEHAIRLVSPAA